MRIGQDIEHLLLRRVQGIATADENEFIETWANESAENRVILNRLETKQTLREDLGVLFDLVDTEKGAERLQRMELHIRQHTQKPYAIRTRRWLPYVAAAAMLTLA